MIDLNQPAAVDQYEIPDPIANRVLARDTHSRFPWSSTPARSCDLDHTQPWQPDQDGLTATGNLAPLARREHRAKTYRQWHPTTTAPGILEWTSPHGLTYLTGPFGTLPGPTRTRRPRRGRLITKRRPTQR